MSRREWSYLLVRIAIVLWVLAAILEFVGKVAKW